MRVVAEPESRSGDRVAVDDVLVGLRAEGEAERRQRIVGLAGNGLLPLIDVLELAQRSRLDRRHEPLSLRLADAAEIGQRCRRRTSALSGTDVAACPARLWGVCRRNQAACRDCHWRWR